MLGPRNPYKCLPVCGHCSFAAIRFWGHEDHLELVAPRKWSNGWSPLKGVGIIGLSKWVGAPGIGARADRKTTAGEALGRVGIGPKS